MKATAPSLYLHHAATLLVAVTPGMLGGCTTATSIGFDANVNVDLFAFKTFAILPWPRAIRAQSSIQVRDAMYLATQAMRSAMTKRGYREVPIISADVVLNLRSSGLPENDVAIWGLTYTDSNEWSANYRPGSGLAAATDFAVVVEVFQNSTARLVWAGWRQGRAAATPNIVWYEEAVQSILDNFPPAVSP